MVAEWFAKIASIRLAHVPYRGGRQAINDLVFVPAGTPAPIVARLNAEINKALAEPSIRTNLLQAAQEPVGGTAEAFARLFHDDDEKYGRLVKELDIKTN
jgi:tripartite-type tricarboxylate transporter receptor subunit TctC